MTLLSWVSKNARSMGKIGLYGVGGILIGYPALRFANNLYKGETLENCAVDAAYIGTGYNMNTGKLDTVRTRDAVARTVVGGLAILAARKI